jgi:hypothetical protein
MTSNTTTARNIELAELFAEQELALRGMLEAVIHDRRSAYTDGHFEWLDQEDLRLYREKLEGLARVAGFFKGYHEFMARD